MCCRQAGQGKMVHVENMYCRTRPETGLEPRGLLQRRCVCVCVSISRAKFPKLSPLPQRPFLHPPFIVTNTLTGVPPQTPNPKP